MAGVLARAQVSILLHGFIVRYEWDNVPLCVEKGAKKGEKGV